MLSSIIKNLSILKKFLFINFIIFLFIGTLTIIYLNYVQPNLIKKKTSIHIQIINNTVQNLNRLNINFNKEDVKNFLFSKRFLFQSVDRVVFLDEDFQIIADTNTLDLDPRSFNQRIDIIQFDIGANNNVTDTQKKKINEKKKTELIEKISDYALSENFGKPFTFTTETYQQFKLSTVKNLLINDNPSGYLMISESANDIKTAINERKTFVIRTAIFVGIVIFIFSLVLNRYFLKPIKNVFKNGENVGYVAITENANDVKAAIDERKTFIIRTALAVGLVILIFSFVLNRYFLKPIKNLVNYTNKIKNKDNKKINIDNLKIRNDELGLLSSSLDEMTLDLQKRIFHAENFSTDLVHEIRNPLASLKSASEILNDTKDADQRLKLINILSHDVQRIERLITDYSQILKDEVALSKEKFKKIDLIPIIKSVVDDYNNIYQVKRDIKIYCIYSEGKVFLINGIENRIEQIIANLLDNAISFSEDKKGIEVKVSKNETKKVVVNIIDEGQGFKEKDTSKIFKRFYSNRPEKFGQHSGLGLNIVKNLVDLHKASITASNRNDKKGANIEIIFPKL